MSNELKTIQRIMVYPWLTFGLVIFTVSFIQKIITGTLFEKGLIDGLEFIFYLGALSLYQIYFFKEVGYKGRR